MSYYFMKEQNGIYLFSSKMQIIWSVEISLYIYIYIYILHHLTNTITIQRSRKIKRPEHYTTIFENYWYHTCENFQSRLNIDPPHDNICTVTSKYELPHRYFMFTPFKNSYCCFYLTLAGALGVYLKSEPRFTWFYV